MKTTRSKLLTFLALAAMAVIVGANVVADTSTAPPAGAEMKLPAGWTPEDMQACMMAATPGKPHAYLAEGVGEWTGKNQTWMGPNTEPMSSESTTTVTPMMDGRFVKVDMKGEMPGAGPFNGFAINGYDNVSGQFVAVWIDNMGTGMANGTGKLSDDGKVMTWTFTFNCPITKKPAIIRQVETTTGPDAKTLEVFTADPKTGEEYKMMSVELARKK